MTEFTRDELWRIVDEHALPVEDRRKLDDLHAAARRLPKSVLREILLGFDRDRLKEICRALDLDDGGKLKAVIVDRLVGVHDNDADLDDTSEPESNPKPSIAGNARVRDELNRDELLYVIDHYGLSVDDRRRREDVLDAAANLSVAQFGAVLKYFSRDRLKEICRALGLDDGGKRKLELVRRLLGEQLFEDDDEDEDKPDDNEARKPDDNEARRPDDNEARKPDDNEARKPDDNKARKPDDSEARRRGRPRLFIGSTVEALPVAHEVQAELDHDFEVTVWSQSLFGPGSGTWSRLVEMARNEFDFALLVFNADDVVESRGASAPAPRDNVLLEYGLFVGTVGPERTFFLFNRDHRPKLASDLAGVTALTYGDREDGNLQAAVGPACTALRKHAKLGRR